MSRHLGLLGLLLVSRTLDAAPIRGLDPALSSHYTSGATFTCLDGTETLSSAAINDDFCDCVDGSDEPGIDCSVLADRSNSALTTSCKPQVLRPAATASSTAETGLTSPGS